MKSFFYQLLLLFLSVSCDYSNQNVCCDQEEIDACYLSNVNNVSLVLSNDGAKLIPNLSHLSFAYVNGINDREGYYLAYQPDNENISNIVIVFDADMVMISKRVERQSGIIYNYEYQYEIINGIRLLRRIEESFTNDVGIEYLYPYEIETDELGNVLSISDQWGIVFRRFKYNHAIKNPLFRKAIFSNLWLFLKSDMIPSSLNPNILVKEHRRFFLDQDLSLAYEANFDFISTEGFPLSGTARYFDADEELIEEINLFFQYTCLE